MFRGFGVSALQGLWFSVYDARPRALKTPYTLNPELPSPLNSKPLKDLNPKLLNP